MGCEAVICDANNLYRAYTNSIRGSRWKESTQRFSLNFLRNIFDIQDSLENRTLENGPVQEFELRERGRVRPISSLHINDRIIRHVLCDDVLMPEVRKRIIYDNGSSISGRGLSFSRKRFEVHLRKYYQTYGKNGYILFGDFSKFYDNIRHDIAKKDFLELFGDDEFLAWLLDIIFEQFKVDVSYMTDEEYASCMETLYNKLAYREIPKDLLTGEKFMEKSVNIGDQLSQVIGIYYANRVDTYIKYVRGQKFYGRYMDDWYIISPSKDELLDILENIRGICGERGIFINEKKTRIMSVGGTYRYLQVKYFITDDGKIVKRINPKRVTAMRRKLSSLADKVGSGELDYEFVDTMFRGWMCNHYKLMSRAQRQSLISQYEELFGKTVTVSGKKMIICDKSFQKEELAS